jgi:glycosyltransferase involved in cell wall biosynthesis
MKSLISVVMAAKNYGRYLPAAIASVQAQTDPDWELVIVDDGSEDDTPAVAQRYLGDPRIRYSRSDRLGQTRAKNLGVSLARGPLIAFLDADDVWLPEKLEKQRPLLEPSEVGVVFSLRKLIDHDGRLMAYDPGPLPPRGWILPDVFNRNFICFSTTILKREVLDRIGGFDPNLDLSIDYDLWLRASRHYAFDYVPEPLVLYRTGHGNLSQKLSDRIATASTIVHRAVTRRGAEIPERYVHASYASAAHEMGWLLRGGEPWAACQWYLQEMRYPGHRLAACRGMARVAWDWLRGHKAPLAAVNATANR